MLKSLCEERNTGESRSYSICMNSNNQRSSLLAGKHELNADIIIPINSMHCSILSVLKLKPPMQEGRGINASGMLRHALIFGSNFLQKD